MRAKVAFVGVCLGLVAGLLLLAAGAWAQAIKTPISGLGEGCQTLPPSQQKDRRIWTDADGVHHVRNQKQRCQISGDIEGRSVGYESFNYDSSTGHVDLHAYAAFTGTLLGEPASGTVRHTMLCEDEGVAIICQEEAQFHFDNGSIARIAAIAELSTPPPAEYTGVLLDPPGRD